MAKRIQLSADDATYYTLPGNSGELRNEAGELVDTIFGQEFESTETGLITGTISTNALYKGFAGYVVKLQKSDTPVALTDEPMSQVGASLTYQITDAAKQVLNIGAAITIEDNSVVVDAEDIESINYLTGEVTFVVGTTVTGPVTISGEYIPLVEIAGARTFTLTQTANPIDDTDIPTARANGGFRTFDRGGLKTVSLEIGGVYKAVNAFRQALIDREEIVVSINPDNSDLSVARGLFKYTSEGQSGDVGALEEETLMLRLSVPQDEEYIWGKPFGWTHSALSKLSQAVMVAIASWQDNSPLYAKYLHDGTNGLKSEVVVTDLSLAGGLESMNEFTVSLQMSGSATPVP